MTHVERAQFLAHHRAVSLLFDFWHHAAAGAQKAVALIALLTVINGGRNVHSA